MKQFLAGTVVGGVMGTAVGGFLVFDRMIQNKDIREAWSQVVADKIIDILHENPRPSNVRPLRTIVAEDEPNPLHYDLRYEVPAEGELDRVFDSANLNWSANREENKIFLNTQRNYLHDLLNSRGHVFLNEVYDLLGFDRTSHGAVLGWVKEDARTSIFDYEATVNPIVFDILIPGAGVVFDRIEDQEQQGV